MENFGDRIAKHRLNIILLIDCSKSMQGERIAQVNQSLAEIKPYLEKLEMENENADFYITVITFSNEAYLQHGDKMKLIDDYDPTPIKAAGWSNMHLAFIELADLLKKENKGGIMPDFGGIAPIILLMTDGHPTKPITNEIEALNKLPWFRVALKYGIAIGLDDKRTMDTLNEFVQGNGDVLSCLDDNALKKIIKVIVVTASKVKSTSASAAPQGGLDQQQQVIQQVRYALTDVDDWEW